MAETISNNIDNIDHSSDGDSRIIHGFNPIAPDSRNTQKVPGSLESDLRIYQKIGEVLPVQKEKEEPLKSSIFGATIILNNICLGTTIFTFAIRAKSFGLVWFLFFCIITGFINYWTIMRGGAASYKYKENDYSQLTSIILGKKAGYIVSIFMILYSYALMICFLSLIYPLIGRFVQNIAYNNKYDTYEDFEKSKWGNSYIKFPFFVAIIFFIAIISLVRNSNKLKFLGYFGIIAVFYTLFIVMIQCSDYYNYYKNTKYNKNDIKTHPNWLNLGNAFTKDLDFFKGMANLFCAYACHPRVYQVFAGFKTQKNGIKKMRYGVIFATCLTTSLHIISIVCSFLTDPYAPEDLVLYRKKKGNGKDIAMSISILLVAINLAFNIPGYYFDLRSSISISFTGGKITDKFNYIFTFLSFLGCTIIALLYNKILHYLTYIGGFISVFICYLNPILIYVFSTEKKLKYWKNIVEIIFAIILCIIGIIAGILTIIDDIKNLN